MYRAFRQGFPTIDREQRAKERVSVQLSQRSNTPKRANKQSAHPDASHGMKSRAQHTLVLSCEHRPKRKIKTPKRNCTITIERCEHKFFKLVLSFYVKIVCVCVCAVKAIVFRRCFGLLLYSVQQSSECCCYCCCCQHVQQKNKFLMF